MQKGEKVNYFVDTEFSSDKVPSGNINLELISLGLVDDKGRTFYAESTACNPEGFSSWIWQNVVPHLEFLEFAGNKKEVVSTPTNIRMVGSPQEIAHALADFIDNDGDPEDPEFWIWFGQHDWVLLCWLFGIDIDDLPEGWPRTYREISQMPGNSWTPPKMGRNHHALDDAIWHKKIYELRTA